MNTADAIIARLPVVAAVADYDSESLTPCWVPEDLSAILTGDYTKAIPDVLRFPDGDLGLFYRGETNGMHGDSGIGKSWLTQKAVAQVIQAGRRAVIIDYESRAEHVVGRLRDLGCTVEDIRDRFTYIRGMDPTDDFGVAAFVELLTDDTDLVVIDSLGEAFAVDGVDENSDADVGPWLRRVARRVADVGPAVVLVDHSTKATNSKVALHASGSKRKRADITGASYFVASKKPPTRTRPGTLTVICAKDRPGVYDAGALVATVDIAPHPDGITVVVHRKDQGGAELTDQVVRRAAKEAVAIVDAAGEPLSTKKIEERMKVKASTDKKRKGIELAVELGSLTVEDGPRGSKLHTYQHDLPEDET